MTDYQAGTAVPAVSQISLRRLRFGVPQPDEQRRIVERVNELIGLCDELESRQERRHFTSTRFRGSALHALTEAESPDELREAWDRVSANWAAITAFPDSTVELEAALLHLAVRGRLTRPNPDDWYTHTGGCGTRSPALPPGWSWKPLQELVDPQRSISYGVIKLGPDPGPTGVSILRCSDVRRMGIDQRNIRHITKALSDDYRRTILRGGEHLVNIRGTLGGCAIAPMEMAGFNIAREVAVVPTVGIDPDFLLYVFASPDFLEYTTDSLRGTAYQGLNLSLLRKFPVPVPPADEQIEIVKCVREMLAACKPLGLAIEAVARAGAAVSRSLTQVP